jgi:hypothetical protein
MLMLALSYQLGASTATAQGGTVECVSPTACVINHHLLIMQGGPVPVDYGELPKATTAIAVDATNGALVLFQDGEVWENLGDHWVFRGTFPISGPVPALHNSWGQLKSRYAPNGGTVSKGADTK